jgi:hypothetical protein
MKTSNLLIVSGLALVGGYFFFRKKKDKTDTQLLVLQNTQPQTATLSQLEVESKPNKQAIITPQEATVYATKTIADVNSLMVKYPPLTSQQFLDNYNKTYGTNLIMSGDAIVGFSFVSPNQPQIPSAPVSTTSKWGGLINSVLVLNNQATAKLESDAMASNANSQFKGQQMAYTRWKSDFATVYSDLKNYFSTLTKEEADIKVKFLPKLIIKSLMGDSDPRVRANDFYTQEEIIDFIDNSGIKNPDEVLGNALKQFSNNFRQFNRDFSGVMMATASVTPKYN